MGTIRQSYNTGEQTIICPYGSISEPQGEAVISYVNRSGVLQKIHGYDKDGVVFMFESGNPLVDTHTKNTYGRHPQYMHPAYGHHHVLVSSERAGAEEQWPNMMVAVQDCMKWLHAQRRVGYVTVFTDMDGILQTPRLQIATFQGTPPAIQHEIKAANAAEIEMGACNMCQIAKNINDPRHMLQTDSFVAVCPWAPSCPYEFWITPKRHNVGFLRTSQKDLMDLALIIHITLGGVAHVLGDQAYSMAFRLSPEKKNTHQFHWYIGVYPRTPVPLSMKQGYGIAVCNTSPEESAKKLGAAGRRELARVMGID